MERKTVQVQDIDRIFREEGDRIYSLLLYWCRNPDDAGDMLQTVFLRFMERVEKGLEIENSPRAYLIRIARNLYYDRFRQRKFVTELSEENLVQRDLKNFVSDTESGEIRDLFFDSLKTPPLPEEVVEVMELRFVRHFEVAEICEVVDKWRSTVYRLMEKGIRVMTGVFRKAGYDVAE